MKISDIIKNHQLQSLFIEGNFGIEKEGLRTDMEEKLAMTDHPYTLGSRLYHPYMMTDFSEAQPELITPVRPSLELSMNWLEALHDVLHRSLPDDEYLWPNSMPNILPEEEEIPIIRYNDPDAIRYREYLAESYGKKKQTISGIHFNFSFSDAFIEAVFEHQSQFNTLVEFKNDLYIKLAGNFLKYEWVLLYLFGASPYADPSFYDSKSGRLLKKPTDYVRSLRNSSFGYHNHEEVIVNYDSVECYVKDIENFVETGHLSEEREFYGNARLRGRGERLRDMLDTGVDYIEFRSFDLNPLDRLGISYDQGRFYHLFFLYMVWLDSEATVEEITEGQEKNLNTADENPFESSAFKEEGLQILEDMSSMLNELSLNDKYGDLIDKAKEKFEYPDRTLSARVAAQIDEQGYLAHGRELGLKYKHYSTDRPYVLNGFEDMELSTQLLMYDALELGVEMEIIDRADQFLKLSHEDRVEYVRNGNMTSKDTTISHFIMENKTVTKKILAEAGYSVPGGGEYHSLEEAMANYLKYKDQAIVIKPKSTNYGIG
ncbi:MAG TPA: bifunctional glutamate--cysteine ligase GshA/glutathione synthetase GshB, partial [Atopostipes sp.]|nr:bifunctional glutamate--cysteine ligase GshA/glutathione synthetase GshB [Atopostipes sp.]